MISSIKAKDTLYKGHLFRSKLEAKWAVVLDTLGIRWVYEPTYFRLKGEVNYRPDFWIPDHDGYWIEIKGKTPTYLEEHKCRLLAARTGAPVYLLWGDCGPQSKAKCFTGLDGPFSDPGTVLTFNSIAWRACTSCGDIGLWRDDSTCEMFCRFHDNPLDTDQQVKLLMDAYVVARHTKFEYEG